MKSLAAMLVGCVALVACSDQCGNKEITRSSSPDGKLDAVLFQRDCGATTGFSTQVSIVPSGKAVAGGGKIFVADDDHGAARSGSWGGPWSEVEWSSPTELHIRYAARSQIFVQERTKDGVKISYTAN